MRVYKVRKIKKKYNIDKSISFTENANIINILSRYKEKVIISVRNQKSKEIEASSQNIQKKIIKNIYNKADNIVAISNGVKRDLIDNFYIDKMKTTVIYNPVDIKYIDSLKNEEIEDKYKYIFDENTIITSGRLTYQKGQWYLIRALKKVKKELPNAKLVILGQGELEKNLKKLVAELNLEDSVFFLGFKSNPFKYIKNSKVFVLPSLFEGFGNVITETMECGTIVISTDCKSGPKEILNPSNMEEKVNDMFIANYGILIPVFDGKVYNATEKLTKEEDILANTIIEVLKNMQLCLQLESKIFERVKDFEVNSIVKEWCKF